jgi:hypothetical protein
MATRDKYDYTQQTILWGTINYNDVPSYSATSVGTTGNAYLVRNFLKQFFPFLDLSVKKTAGGSVNVAIQNFTVKFNFTEGGIFKEFVLNSKSLEDVLEPLFEGQGFDGMTDSTYSIPLPPMYNDEGQDVGYGYGYLFVRNENVEGEYLVNLDNLMFVNKVSFDVPPNSNLNYKSNLFTIPKKTIDYIKSNGVIPTANIPQGIYPTPTTNQSDLVTLEKGDSKVSLTTLEQEIIDFLAEKQNQKVDALLTEIISEFENKNYARDLIKNRMGALILADLIESKTEKYDFVYFLSAKGLQYVTPKQASSDNQNDPQQIVIDSTNKGQLTSGEIAASDFISKNISILTDMSKDDPELFDGLSAGIRLILSLTKKDTGQLEPFKPLENLQQLEEQLKEEDFDLSEVDLEELDLTGLEDDLELNDDELSDFDLTEFNELSDFVESELMPSMTPVDIANLNALEKDILRILDEPPAKGKGTLYNEMDSFEIFAKVANANLPTSDIVKINEALRALIELKLILSSGTFPETFRLIDNPMVADIVKAIKNESVANAPEIQLLPSQFNVLKVLYAQNVAYKAGIAEISMNADSIEIRLKQDNIIYGHNQILKYLEELSDFEFVLMQNDLKGGIIWAITSDGKKYVEKNKTVQQIREEQKQEKAQKTGDGLDYDYYLIASILNQSVNMMITAGDVTAILQSSFNKKPKWDENEILYKLRVLTSLGMALKDIQNTVEYFEISEFGEDVVKYLIEQENKGLYPKSKPTQQTVASRPSPTESATLNPIGTIKQGNDGNNWQVRENKSGVKRWVKL